MTLVTILHGQKENVRRYLISLTIFILNHKSILSYYHKDNIKYQNQFIKTTLTSIQIPFCNFSYYPLYPKAKKKC